MFCKGHKQKSLVSSSRDLNVDVVCGQLSSRSVASSRQPGRGKLAVRALWDSRKLLGEKKVGFPSPSSLATVSTSDYLFIYFHYKENFTKEQQRKPEKIERHAVIIVAGSIL